MNCQISRDKKIIPRYPFPSTNSLYGIGTFYYENWGLFVFSNVLSITQSELPSFPMKEWNNHERKNRHPHPPPSEALKQTPSEDLLAHTCWIALVFSIFDHAGFSRITAIALTTDDTVLLALASFGAVWSYPCLPSLDTNCVNNTLSRCSALQCNGSSIAKGVDNSWVQPCPVGNSTTAWLSVVSPRAWERGSQSVYLPVFNMRIWTQNRTRTDCLNNWSIDYFQIGLSFGLRCKLLYLLIPRAAAFTNQMRGI